MRIGISSATSFQVPAGELGPIREILESTQPQNLVLRHAPQMTEPQAIPLVLQSPDLAKVDIEVCQASLPPAHLAHAQALIADIPELQCVPLGNALTANMQATLVVLAQTLEAANQANLSVLRKNLERIEELDCLSPEVFASVRYFLCQKAYNACLADIRQAASTIDGSLVAILFAKADACKQLDSNIQTESRDALLEVWADSLVTRRKGLILEAVYHARSGSADDAERCSKNARTIHQALSETPIGIESFAPTYMLDVGNDPLIFDFLEHPETLDGNLEHFLELIEQYASVYKIRALSADAMCQIDAIRDSTYLLRELALNRITNVAASTSRYHDAAQSVLSRLLHEVSGDQVSSSQPPEADSPSVISRRVEQFMREHATTPMTYSRQDIEHRVDTLRQNLSPAAFAQPSESDSCFSTLPHPVLTAKNGDILIHSIHILLQHGGTQDQAHEIMRALLNVDLATHAGENFQAQIRGKTQPQLEFKASRLPEFLNDANAAEIFSALLHYAFLPQFECITQHDAQYLRPASLDTCGDVDLMKAIYEQIYDHQSLISQVAVNRFRKIPRLEYAERRSSDAIALRVLHLDILQEKVIGNYGKIQNLFANRSTDALENSRLVDQMVDFIKTFDDLELAARRAHVEFPFEHMQHIDIQQCDEQLEILERERVAQKRRQASAKNRFRQVHFGEDEIRTFRKEDRIEDLSLTELEIDDSFLYNEVWQNIQRFASQGNVERLLDEVEELRKQALHLNRPFPQDQVDSEMQTCYRLAHEKRLGKAIEYATIGDVEQMILQLQPICLYRRLLNSTAIDLMPIMTLGYANSLQNVLDAIDPENVETHRNQDEQARARKILRILGEQAKKFTVDSMPEQIRINRPAS